MGASACSAPYASVYFQPDGVVKSCCATGHQLGRLDPGKQVTLRSILEGRALADQAAALASGDFDLGCRECEVPALHGLRDTSLAADFDWLSGPRPQYPRVMDFALSNHCNLQCVMCNGELSSAIRSQREQRPPLARAYDEHFFRELAEYLPHLEHALFKGGEPFLSADTRRVWDLMLELGISCKVAVTTNATTWNPTVERYLRDLRMHVTVSVDGMSPTTLELIRVGTRFGDVWRNIDRIQRLTRETGRGLTLSWCLMPQNHHEVGAFLAEAQRRNCNPNVVLVNQPEEFDLLQLPPPRLAEVVRALEEEGALLEQTLDGVPLRVWHQTLARLRAHLARPLPVHVAPARGRRPAPDGPPPDLTAVTQELAEWAGVRPLVMTIVDHRVARVDAPGWASWMDTRMWPGLRREDLLHLLADKLGGGGLGRERPRPDEWIDYTLEFGNPKAAEKRLVRILSLLTDGPDKPAGIYLISCLPTTNQKSV